MQKILAIAAVTFLILAHVSESRSQTIIYRGDPQAAVERSYSQAREARQQKYQQRVDKQVAREQKAADREYQRRIKEENKAYYKRVAEHKKRLSGKKK